MDNSDQINVFIRKRKKCIKLIESADLIIMVDFNQPNRLGEAEKYVIASSAVKVIIDHHLEPYNFADLIICFPSRCSTSELVHEMVTYNEWRSLSKTNRIRRYLCRYSNRYREL